MKELAEKLEKEYEKNNFQALIRTKCECGKFAKIVMSSFVCGSNLYSIIYCSHCNKFYKHYSSSCLEIDGETTYSGTNVPIAYGSTEWKKAVNQIEQKNIFASV